MTQAGKEGGTLGAGLGTIYSALLAAVLFALPAATEPIAPGALRVVDGDTVEHSGVVYRLIGLDAPETKSRAKCEAERTLGNQAEQRLRKLVAGGGLDLTTAPCSCQPGTEGTQKCNYGRSCGVLTTGGKDVAGILIGEGLARSYICGKTRCPKRGGWCG